MSRLSDQVEAKIARANRAFRLSSRIIGAAREELEIHGAWLDRHRATWAEEVKRHHRLLKRKLAMRALMRFVVGLVFAAPFALARALEARLKDIPTPASPQSRPAEATPESTRCDVLQRRISRLDEPLAVAEEDAPHAAPDHDETSNGGSASREGAVSRAQAAPARFPTGRIAVSPVSVVILVLIAAGAVGAMLSGPPAEAPPLAAPKAPDPRPQAAASLTLAKTAKVERPAPLSGFAILPAASAPDALWLPPQTVADIMSMTRPLTLEPVISETAPASMAAEPLPSKQANKAKRKRTLVAREPEPLPWWQEWSWIKLR